MNSKKGISLVALVVTIIILLILAGVTVALTIGKDSTTTRAIESKIDSRYATAMDKVKIRETELGVSKFKDQDGSTAKEFVESLFDEGILIPLEDSYEPDYSKVYIGKIEEGVYKYTIDIIELEDDDIDVGPITFTFNLNGGTINSSPDNEVRVGEKGTTFIMPQNPIKENNIFDGWSPSVPDTFDSTKSFIAKWTPMMNTFTFNLDGGNVDGSGANQLRSGVYGAEVTKPKNPVKNNFDFNGWSPSVPNKFDGNKTFMAQWKPKTYTITYNLNGGLYHNSAVNPTRKVGYNNMPPEIEPTKSGQTFMGWTPELTVANSNKTYTAVWSIPMVLELKKASLNEEILIPITFSSGQSALISNNGSVYTQHSSDYPFITNNVAANTPFTVKVAGRIKGFGYGSYYDESKQLYQLKAWGELGATSYKFSGFSNGVTYGIGSLSGTIPKPTLNSFANFHSTATSSMFYNCINLTGSIPTGLFDNCPNVASFYNTFDGCNSLTGSIPVGLFDKCPNVLTFAYTFSGCNNLIGNIPVGLFDKCPNVTTFNSVFSNCKSLTGSIPTGLFDNCSNVTGFNHSFYNCNSLTGNIPGTLFLNCPKVTDFANTFHGCNGLTGNIPGNLFLNCTKVTSFIWTFNNCSELTGSIPGTLFANCSEVQNFSHVFSNSSNLTGLSGDLFLNCLKVTSFDNAFSSCYGLTEIPTGLFDNCPNVTTFVYTFFGCNGLTGSIPVGLFDNCPNVTTFAYTFFSCNGLTGSIPVGLFDNCPNTTSFVCTFSGCNSLTGSIPTGLFDNCQNVTSFYWTFYNCNALTGNALPLWNRTGVQGTQCYRFCTLLTGYYDDNVIPAAWK